MGIKQLWSAGTWDRGSFAGDASLGCWSRRSARKPDFSWSDPYYVSDTRWPGVLLRRQSIRSAWAQQSG